MSQASGEQLVSVIIPAYNAEAHIEAAVRSALAQTYLNIEVVVVDDGSTDRTPHIVERLGAQDRRLRAIRTENSGVAAARNAGVRATTGQFVAMLDADDVWHPEKLAKQLQVFRRRDEQLGLVYCYYREIDDAGIVLSTPPGEPYEGWVFPILILYNFAGSGSGALIRRSCIEEAGGFDPVLRARKAQGSEDTKLFLAIAARYKFGVVPEYLLGYRQSPTSMSSNVRQMRRSQRIVLSEVRNEHPELQRRLFRWANGENCLWLASLCFDRGRLCLGLVLLGHGLFVDPVAVFRPTSLRNLRHGIVMALRASRLLGRVGRMTQVVPFGPARSSLLAVPDKAAAPVFGTLAPDWIPEQDPAAPAPSQAVRRRLAAASMSLRPDVIAES